MPLAPNRSRRRVVIGQLRETLQKLEDRVLRGELERAELCKWLLQLERQFRQ